MFLYLLWCSGYGVGLVISGAAVRILEGEINFFINNDNNNNNDDSNNNNDNNNNNNNNNNNSIRIRESIFTTRLLFALYCCDYH